MKKSIIIAAVIAFAFTSCVSENLESTTPAVDSIETIEADSAVELLEDTTAAAIEIAE